jgi:hypothetical protein
MESRLRQQIEERQKVVEAISGRGEACWSNLHHAKVAAAPLDFRDTVFGYNMVMQGTS